jgi:hypothetical protein
MSGGELLPRRHWLIATIRYLTLGAMGLFVWRMVARSDGVCPRFTSPCRECQLLAHCQLPKAQEERVKAGIHS